MDDLGEKEKYLNKKLTTEILDTKLSGTSIKYLKLDVLKLQPSMVFFMFNSLFFVFMYIS